MGVTRFKRGTIQPCSTCELKDRISDCSPHSKASNCICILFCSDVHLVTTGRELDLTLACAYPASVMEEPTLVIHKRVNVW